MVKPQVVHVLWTLGRAGAERMVFDLARTLPERGYDVTVVAAGGGGEMAADFRDARIPLLIGPDAGKCRRTETVSFLRGTIKRLKPEVWHTHLGADVWGGWAAKRERLSPWVMTAHSHEPDLSLLQRVTRKWAYRHADHVVAVSQGVADTMRMRYGLERDRLSVIRVGIDASRFAHLASRISHLATQDNSEPIRILSVGRLAPEKDHATLLRALAAVKQPWHLTIAGTGPERLALERLASSLHILPRVTFAGSVPDAAPLLARADLFCFPSLHEGQGVALVEAAFAGVPIIASDLPSLRESFDDKAVRYVPPRDVSAWTAAIEDTVLHFDAARMRTECALDIAHDRFTLPVMADAYAELYRWLLPG